MSPMTVFSGSTLGTAEAVADHLSAILKRKNINHTLIHGPKPAEIVEEGIWILVTSTHGAGNLPDNLQPLFDFLQEQRPDLSQLSYVVVALGDSSYDTFCHGGKSAADLLTQLGAQRIAEILQIDAAEHLLPEEVAGPWFESWLLACKKNLLLLNANL